MIESNGCDDEKEEKVSWQKEKKAYTKPRMTNLGHIEKLTKGSGKVRPEAGGTYSG